MDFELAEEQQIFFDAVRKYAAAELADGALARAHSDDYPWDIAAKFADFGLLGITIPACLLYTSPSPRDGLLSRMPSSA